MKNKSGGILKYVFSMIKYKPLLFLFNAILNVFLFTYNAVPIYIIREVLNRVSLNTEVNSTMIWLFALLIGAGLARVVLILTNGLTHYINIYSLISLVRRNMMEAILNKKDIASISGASGEALNSFKEDASYCISPISKLLDIIGTTAYTVTAIVFLIYINPMITFFVFTPLALIVFIIRKVTDRIRNYRRENREITSNISEVIGDISSSIQTIKVSGAQNSILEHFDELNKTRHKVVMKDVFFMTILNAVTDSTVHFGTAIILLFVASSMQKGTFTVGDFSVFVYYLSSVADYMQRLGGFMAGLKQSEISFERVNTMLKVEEEQTLVEHKPIYIRGEIKEPSYSINDRNNLEKLEVKGLTYHFPGTEKGIQNINFKINKGSFVAITGRVGSGKSTLLEAFLGLIPTSSGEIYWNGKKIESCHEFFTPPNVGYIPQVPTLFMDTVKENILLGLPEDKYDLKKAMHLAVLENDIPKLEKGLETNVGPMGSKLSGGQAQRTAIARMFIREPELLVFDDISSALDIETELTMWQRLAQERREKNSTYLVISNKKTVLQQADQIILMVDGKVENQGTLAELLENSKEFQEIWGEEVVVAI